MYDPEAVIQDADIQQAEMNYIGKVMFALERRGICTHTSAVGYVYPPVYPEQIGLTEGQVRCHGCGTVFESDDEWISLSEAVLTMTPEQLNTQPRTRAWLSAHMKEGN